MAIQNTIPLDIQESRVTERGLCDQKYDTESFIYTEITQNSVVLIPPERRVTQSDSKKKNQLHKNSNIYQNFTFLSKTT